MIHPGSWQDYSRRPDNKNLTTEELTYKYKQELIIHENFNYIQNQIQHQDNQGKRAPAALSSTSLLDYPTFDSPLTAIAITDTSHPTIGSSGTAFPRGPLTQSTINTIVNRTATHYTNFTRLEVPTAITSVEDISVGTFVTWQGVNSGASPNFNLVTNRNLPQTDPLPVWLQNDKVQWTSGAREYIFNLDYTNFEIVDIVSFIVP